MSVMVSGFNKRLLLLSLVFMSTQIHAGSYIFSGDSNGVDIITHPSTYTGSQSLVTVRLCIDPASPNAASMEIPIQNNINIFNRLQSTIGNIQVGGNNNVGGGQLDFESVALHEIGHCLGMGHANLASESGFTDQRQNYTRSTNGVNAAFDVAAGSDGVVGSGDDVRGDDVNLHWFRKSNNNPFTIDSIIDASTYSVNIADLPAGDLYAANADRGLAASLGLPVTEAVMQQGTLYDEAQRALAHDDVATILYAASGLDEQSGTADDYVVQLEYGGISNTNCDININITTTTSLAFCSTGGAFLGPGHTRITTASIEFGDAFNWFYNQDTVNQAPVLVNIGNQTLVEQDVLQINISASDVDGDALTVTASGLPAFATFFDNGDGSATITVSPVLGQASISQLTITVSDNGLPNVSTQEIIQLTVDPLDTDGDGISDYDEINIYGTLPGNPDSDGDFINDGAEITNASDPLDPLSWPNFADGDIAPLGSPDGLINAADYLVAQRITLGLIPATSLELAHGDLFPAGSPDGVIDTSDLILLLKLVQQ